MELIRSSIIDLLGKNSSRYHSCVLTTYSFSFSFFEVQLMRRLRQAGMHNVLVLLDEKQLDALTQEPSGLEFSANAAYGIYPMEAPGAFHPKILFCVGHKEGFLAIGSGNLTSAGHGTNDELWSVYHIKNGEAPQLALFQQCWVYLQQLTQGVEGSAREKMQWLEQHASWLAREPKERATLPESEEVVSIFAVAPRDMGWARLCDELQGKSVRQITLFSPYFDREGQVLQACREDFPAAKLRVITEQQSRLLPFMLPSTAGITFYDWQQLQASKEEEGYYHPLHAKLWLFELSDGSEVALLGSSNATTAAIGTTKSPALNHELNVLIRRAKGGVMRELGFQLNAKAIFELPAPPEDDPIVARSVAERPMLSLKIKFAELEQGTISLYTQGQFNEPVRLVYFDRFGQPIGEQNVANPAVKKELELPDELDKQQPTFVEWKNTDGEVCSNRQLVQDLSYHQRGNPDPRLAKVNALFAQMSDGQEELVGELLQYLSFEDSSTPQLKSGTAGKARENRTKTSSTVYQQSESYEDFVEPEEEARQRQMLQSDTMRLAEFLTVVRREQFDAEEDLSVNEDEQEDLDLDEDQGREAPIEAAVNAETVRQRYQLSEQLYKHLGDYHELLLKKTSPIIKGAVEDVKVSGIIDAKNYGNFLICASLLTRNAGHLVDEEAEEPVYILPLHGDDEDYLCAKGFCREIIGKFHLRQLQPHQEKLIPANLRKLRLNIRSTYFYSIYLICNSLWGRGEQKDKLLLLANSTIPLLGGKLAVAPEQLLRELKDWMDTFLDNGRRVSIRFHEEFDHYCEELYPKLVDSFGPREEEHKIIQECTVIMKGDFIFRSTLGLCSVTNNFKQQDGQCKLTITHPGFRPDADGKREITLRARRKYRQVVL